MLGPFFVSVVRITATHSHEESRQTARMRAMTAYTDPSGPYAEDRMPAVVAAGGHLRLYGVTCFSVWADAFDSERYAAGKRRILSSSSSGERGNTRCSRPRQRTWTKSNV
jgi:hypothetical protein